MKLPPPPCAVLLVNIYIYICGFTHTHIYILYPVISCSSFLISRLALDISQLECLISARGVHSTHCSPRVKVATVSPENARTVTVILASSSLDFASAIETWAREDYLVPPWPDHWLQTKLPAAFMKRSGHPSPNSGGGWELSLNLKYLEMKNAIWYHLISSNLGASLCAQLSTVSSWNGSV